MNRPVLLGAVLISLCAAFAAACSNGSGDANPTATPTIAGPTATPSATPNPPSTGTDVPADRDLLALARRFRASADLPDAVELPPLSIGDEQQIDLIVITFGPSTSPQRRTATATVLAISEHAYILAERGTGVSTSEAQTVARTFEQTVWPRTTEAFGLPAIPGVDGDPRIVIMLADLPSGLGGYVTDSDAYVQAVAPRSNQREIIYLNTSFQPFTSSSFTATLAHEFQHLIHGAIDQGEESWVNEGLSELAAVVVLGGGGSYGGYLNRPDTQLNTWSDGAESGIHYDASGLFFAYLYEQNGSSVLDLVAQAQDGIAGIEAFLRASGDGRNAAQLFADWAVANYLDLPNGPYGYGQRNVSAPTTERVRSTGAATGEVRQFAADYLELRAQDFSGPVSFALDGATETATVDFDGADGAYWWGNRGDNIDSTLTRELDLTGVQEATLTFRTWYEIEGWFDFAHVAVSQDDGASWRVLTGQHTTLDDPIDILYGPSYYGESGGGGEPRWVEERIDLTRFAGSRILVRFEYITDESYSERGWAIDDIAVPEIGFFDDAESDAGGWHREGFLRITEPLQQRFELRLITMGSTPEVLEIALDAENRANVPLDGLGSAYQRAIIVVIATTEGTTTPASYSYEITIGGAP